MSELGFERRVQMSHSELTSGHDVPHLLSNINQNFKKSKADQILRLLHDQDKLQDDVEEIENIDEEYNKIREEKVICDSDTLTDSSSDSESDVTVAEQEEIIDSDKIMISSQNNPKSKEGRCKTSIGFYGFERNDSGIHLEHESDAMTDKVFDTRDLNIRPKSSYVRRGHLYRKNTETGMDTSSTSKTDVTGDVSHRAASAKNRPKSRLGRDSVNRFERKIEMVEATPIVPTEVPAKEDNESTSGAAAGVYRRFERTRTPVPRRGSKRTKGFCEDNTNPTRNNVSGTSGHISGDNNMHSPRNVYPVYSDMDTSVHDVTISMVPHASTVTRTPVQNISNSTVPKYNTVQSNQHRHQTSQPANAETYTRHHREGSQVVDHHTQHANYVNTRSDTVNTAASSVKPETIKAAETDIAPVKRTSSNLHSSFIPKNPEPITTRPMGRPDIRPGTRQRRLTRRYMQQTANPMNSVRPTSESVILARQKTEKSLLKKQADNRPHSEKIPPTNKILSVSNNPTQGPQTNITSKEGMTQSSHVGAGGFRGYDPGSRMKSSTRSRDVPADLTLPRSGQSNVMYGGRKPLAALMKLPPLEASLAAKKKERGLTLAQRETCV